MNIIISPHIDDAMLSIGGSIINWQKKGEQCLVVNIFTTTDFVVSKDSAENSESSILRKREEQNVANMLDFKVQNLDYPDATVRGYKKPIGPLAYFSRINRGKDNNLIKEIENILVTLFKKNPGSVYYFPLSPAGHVDHLITREVISRLIREGTIRNFVFYEDLPYCCRYSLPEAIIKEFDLEAKLEKIDIDKKLYFLEQYKYSVKKKWVKEIKNYHYKIGNGNYCERYWLPSNRRSRLSLGYGTRK